MSATDEHRSVAPVDARPTLKEQGDAAQLQQWLDSFANVRGHEPDAAEIEAFLIRHGIGS